MGAREGHFELRHFPDGETYVRVSDAVIPREAWILCDLSRPDPKILPLLFLASTLKKQGAETVGLIAPYLAYMRQDKAFAVGEAVTSRTFADFISHMLDRLITIDPHLHRIHDLSEIYSIPTRVLHAAQLLAPWIVSHVKTPLLIGPDSESAQWVSLVAQELGGAPWVVLEKIRHGDRDVRIAVPDLSRYRNHTPVLIDDIISTGHTLLEALRQLQAQSLPHPVCLGVHGVFAGDAYEKLSGCAQVVTCNTIPHPSNAIDVSSLLAEGLRSWLSPN